MIRGYWWGPKELQRPYVDAVFRFPTLDNRTLPNRAILNTAAVMTTFAPTSTIVRLLERIVGIRLADLPEGPTVPGPTGRRGTRLIQTDVTLGDFSKLIVAQIIEPRPDDLVMHLPPVLGWDILSNFTLVLDRRTNRVLLLDPQEAESLNLP